MRVHIRREYVRMWGECEDKNRTITGSGEADKSNMQILHNTQYKYRPTAVHNLDVIISVGYRVFTQMDAAQIETIKSKL